ncbi:TPA: ABC transporter ATP-binding protein [Vibrio cholerae]|uniref:ABC transporter ATP-binding protein n=1 Tax=Vibrio cholerae TaxID=666 RepID=UPI000D209509|nr:sn-glycerol-3-phosphate ABC transporter ATP-binding protein UgpC [Vibrio cholerae]SPM18582.1 ABC transporter ATP-binding protein,Maltose/maltodextrin import ATP-binding protein MalK,glycerol-3-phosphate transporter ATP-binding subunit,ABC-type spermidine/putrescine transport sy stems, ATPase components,putative 2-aminoethylphosphonate A BC transporter, ATP-binding protein,ABC transporter [Vibrio cholerae]
MAELKLNKVNKFFNDVQTIFDVDLDIEDGEFVVFVGPSGCGKSTLLRLIAGLETTTSGDIQIGDRVVNKLDPSKRGIAMVFQSYALYPHMTVRQNMSIGLKVSGVSAQEIERKVNDAAKILQLDKLMDRKPSQLSGGQRQRVAIGRAIVRNPDVFLFDEPLSNLDAELRVQMRLEISALHEQIGSTMVYVTHDQVEAMTMADKIVVLRAGKVVQVGKPMELYNNPVNQFVAGFIGSPKMNFIPLTLESQSGKNATFKTIDGEAVNLILEDERKLEDVPMSLGIRPEHIALGDEYSVDLKLTVNSVELLGGTSYVHASQGKSKNLIIEVKSNEIPKRNSEIHFSFCPSKCHLFDHLGRTIPTVH